MSEYDIDIKELKTTLNLDIDFWERMFTIRSAVNKILQDSRDLKIIGSSLDAEIDFYANRTNLMLLNRLEDELRYFFIVSRADIHLDEHRTESAKQTEIPGLLVSVAASIHKKCVRCYHRQRDVDLDKKYPMACYRCIDNMTGKGEVCKYL